MPRFGETYSGSRVNELDILNNFKLVIILALLKGINSVHIDTSVETQTTCMSIVFRCRGFLSGGASKPSPANYTPANALRAEIFCVMLPLRLLSG